MFKSSRTCSWTSCEQVVNMFIEQVVNIWACSWKSSEHVHEQVVNIWACSWKSYEHVHEQVVNIWACSWTSCEQVVSMWTCEHVNIFVNFQTCLILVKRRNSTCSQSCLRTWSQSCLRTWSRSCLWIFTRINRFAR